MVGPVQLYMLAIQYIEFEGIATISFNIVQTGLLHLLQQQIHKERATPLSLMEFITTCT